MPESILLGSLENRKVQVSLSLKVLEDVSWIEDFLGGMCVLRLYSMGWDKL